MSPNPGSRRRIAGERRARPARDVEERAWPPPQPYTPTAGATAGTTPRASSAKTRGPRWSSPTWPVVAALGVLVLVMALVAAVLAGPWGWDLAAVRRHDAVREASSTAPPVAERAAAAILSYDYRSLPADQKGAERYMTPGYRRQYAKTFRQLVQPNAGKLHARVRAVVKSSGVSHADPDRVEVLVYVDQTTVSTANDGQPQLALNRAMFTMQRSGGSWLVDKITSY